MDEDLSTGTPGWGTPERVFVISTLVTQSVKGMRQGLVSDALALRLRLSLIGAPEA